MKFDEMTPERWKLMTEILHGIVIKARSLGCDGRANDVAALMDDVDDLVNMIRPNDPRSFDEFETASLAYARHHKVLHPRRKKLQLPNAD